MDEPRWVVLKFGGTSVSTVERWRTIASEAQARIDDGLRPLIVCSALTGVSNLLERLVREAPNGTHAPLTKEIEARHVALAEAMGLDPATTVRDELDEVARLALGASLVREASPKLHARILAAGELTATRLGVAFLKAQGLDAAWLDARDLLTSEPDPHAPAARRILSATCRYERDPALSWHLANEPAAVLVTQGFIARDRSGATVLLGRGGSDTSAAYFAARLAAVRCEIWTDVPGMYTANPRQVPQARLIRRLDYDEAQEIASTGAKVLHPRCVPPVRDHRIPMAIRWTEHPEAEGTTIRADASSGEPKVKSISSRNGITLVSMETVGMWQQVGFLADAFAIFKAHGLSIDLVSTSESNVTVSLDPTVNALDPDAIARLMADLAPLCQARVIGPCAAVSLVGRNIRALLHRLGPALEAFEEQRVHLVSQAASDLNLTFVIDEDQADKLVRALHGLLFEGAAQDPLFGPPMRGEEVPAGAAVAWWRDRRDDLLRIAAEGSPRYVYDLASIDAAAAEVRKMTALDRVFYAIKANPHPGVLQRLHDAGIGFECVSPGEVDHVLGLFPGLDRERVLFTPNFAPREEYARGLELGVRVTLDNLHPLEHWPDLFRDRELFVRIDPGHGRGHHQHVHTAGATSKFGVHEGELDALVALVARAGARVVGLHAHTGSGIRTPGNWSETALFLAAVAERFPDVRVVDVGGGLGVVEKPGQAALDLAAVNDNLLAVKRAHPGLQLWMEPGRFLVAEAGVLIARVTQLKRKGEVSYVGVDAGMNSLIRPALYGAWHEIVNLTRLDEPHVVTANVVGPICESGDVLGYARPLPDTREGDVILVGTTGAYGHAMASRYNLREPAAEVLLAPA